MNYYLPAPSPPGTRAYIQSDELPAEWTARDKRNAWKAITPVIIHAKPYGIDTKKPFECVAYAYQGDQLLIKLPAGLKVYGRPSVEGEWDEVYMHQTSEAYRLTRSVIKMMKVLVAVAKKAHIDRNKAERNRAAAKEREGRDGTCQICEGRQILHPTGPNKATLVLHGYERPGWGHTVGECYGYHRKPFEVACDALEEWVVSLKNRETYLVETLAGLPARTTLTLQVWDYKTQKDLPVKITPEDYRWKQAMNSEIDRTERSLGACRQEIAYQTKRLEGWHKEHG